MHQLDAGFRLCLNIAKSGNQHSTIERRVRGSWRVLSGPPLGNAADARYGEWLNADLSPDGRTILAQWGGPCEVPNAFFLPASGGRLRTVTGEQEWTKAPMSAGVGWRKDGRAVVRVLSGGCGPDFRRPGLYLIDPESGRGQFVRPLNRREGG
jgi:hypothetical protein